MIDMTGFAIGQIPFFSENPTQTTHLLGSLSNDVGDEFLSLNI